MITIFLIIAVLYFALMPRRTIIVVSRGNTEHEFWDGPVPTEKEREANLQRIFRIIEAHPNGQLAKNNPEYVDEYLSRVELDLPEGVEIHK
ncbi:MAG: hypothetical protein JNK14_05835 [Chitinophagaceae bacterium]|nr:hypothetical protein [Chitinophagaceae bacterium]